MKKLQIDKHNNKTKSKATITDLDDDNKKSYIGNVEIRHQKICIDEEYRSESEEDKKTETIQVEKDKGQEATEINTVIDKIERLDNINENVCQHCFATFCSKRQLKKHLYTLKSHKMKTIN